MYRCNILEILGATPLLAVSVDLPFSDLSALPEIGRYRAMRKVALQLRKLLGFLERTQELIIDLVDPMERGEIPIAPIFLDSPPRDTRDRSVSKARCEPGSSYRCQPLAQFAAPPVHGNCRRKQVDRETHWLPHHHCRQWHGRRRPYSAPSQALVME